MIIPKRFLTKAELKRDVKIEIPKGAVITRKPKTHARAGWAEASRALAADGDDGLVWPEFGNDGDLRTGL